MKPKWVCWHEPMPILGGEDKRWINSVVKVTVKDAARVARERCRDVVKRHGAKMSRATQREWVEDFAACNWAWFEDADERWVNWEGKILGKKDWLAR